VTGWINASYSANAKPASTGGAGGRAKR
jgi:hypothetical protein